MLVFFYSACKVFGTYLTLIFFLTRYNKLCHTNDLKRRGALDAYETVLSGGPISSLG